MDTGMHCRNIMVHTTASLKKFEHLYDTLHIAGYYRGLIYNANVIKEYFRVTKEFIDKFK